MPSYNRQLGALGERIAKDYLQRRGYQILETNFRCREGEIDIVARHGDYLVFVEVRTRKSRNTGTPEESITNAKRQKLVEVANAYLQAHDQPPSPCRIDVVAVELGPGDEILRLEIVENAID